MSSDSPVFGFEGLNDFEPGAGGDTPPVSAEKMEKLDRIANRNGFVSREVPMRRQRRVLQGEPTDQFNIRAGIAHINRFAIWCEREGITYRQGFQRLVDEADL